MGLSLTVKEDNQQVPTDLVQNFRNFVVLLKWLANTLLDLIDITSACVIHLIYLLIIKLQLNTAIRILTILLKTTLVIFC